MKNLPHRILLLLMGFSLLASCSEEAIIQNEPQPARLAKAYQQGQMPQLEGAGMMNIQPPSDSLRYAFENDLELKSREVGLAQDVLASEGDWPALNRTYRNFLREGKGSPHAWYEQPMAANQALYQLFVHFPTEVRYPEDVIFYTEILLHWQSANAWRMAQSLRYLQDFWPEARIRAAAAHCLKSPALPEEEALRAEANDEKALPFLRDMMRKHLEGVGILKVLALAKN